MMRSMNTGVSTASSSSFKHDKKLSYFSRINEERLAFVMSCLVDKEVVVNMESGEHLKGVFNSFDPSSRGANRAVDFAMNSYLPSSGNNEPKSTKPVIVYGNEYHFFSSHGINKSLFRPRDHKANALKKTFSGKFKTDTEISAAKQTKVNSVLTEWKPSDPVTDAQLVELDKAEGGEWDQFETNNREYGVVSTFDESLYTTSLNLNEIPDSVKERAEMLAAEIENSGETSYAHVESMLEDEDVAANEASSASKTLRETKKREKTSYASKFKSKPSHDSADKFEEGTWRNAVAESDKHEIERSAQTTKPKHERQFSHQIGVNALNIEPTNMKVDLYNLGLNDRRSRHFPEPEKREKHETAHAPQKVDDSHTTPQVAAPKSATKHEPEPPKKSFKFNPNASSFTPTLMTEKAFAQTPDNVDRRSVSSPSMHSFPKKADFTPFKSMTRFPRLDLKGLKSAETARLTDPAYDEKWPVNATLSYRDILGDLTPLYPHQKMPMRPPNHMVHHNQGAPMVMPHGPQMTYPPYHMGNPPMGMVQYGGHMPPRFFNGVQYNQMVPNQVMGRRNHMPPPNAQYPPMNPMGNDHYGKGPVNDGYEEKPKGYQHHPKHKK